MCMAFNKVKRYLPDCWETRNLKQIIVDGLGPWEQVRKEKHKILALKGH
jgi:hypothetical protein